VKILAVDDEPQILRALRTSLTARGHDVVTAPNGETALDVLAASEVDLVVLDLGLPGIDGVEVIRRLRSWTSVPVIVLSVRDAQADKVAALDAGADDFVTKPFAMDELLARVRAVLRRTTPAAATPPVLRFGDLDVDLAARIVRRGGREVHLTPTEFALVELMVTNPGKLLTHRWLLQKVWGPGYQEESQYLRVYVAGLRKKLEPDPSSPVLILTEPGVGYRWMAGPAEGAGAAEQRTDGAGSGP
jgi:two-component system, OmpR family, KDP operon response regulator KdpE